MPFMGIFLFLDFVSQFVIPTHLCLHFAKYSPAEQGNTNSRMMIIKKGVGLVGEKR